MIQKIILSILSVILIQLPFCARAKDSYKLITLQSDYDYPGYCTLFNICFNTAEKTIALYNGNKCNANNYTYYKTVDVSEQCKTTHKAVIDGFKKYGQLVFYFYSNTIEYNTQTDTSFLDSNDTFDLIYTTRNYSIYNNTTDEFIAKDISYDETKQIPYNVTDTTGTVDAGKYCNYHAYNNSKTEIESGLEPGDDIPTLTDNNHIVYIEFVKEACPQGYYCETGDCFDNKIPCPAGHTTDGTGADDKSDCKITTDTSLCDKNGCFTIKDL